MFCVQWGSSTTLAHTYDIQCIYSLFFFQVNNIVYSLIRNTPVTFFFKEEIVTLKTHTKIKNNLGFKLYTVLDKYKEEKKYVLHF